MIPTNKAKTNPIMNKQNVGTANMRFTPGIHFVIFTDAYESV